MTSPEVIFTICRRTTASPYHILKFLLAARSTVSNRKTRNSQMLNIPLFRSATGQKTFRNRVMNILNNLNNNVKSCIDVNSFRNKLRGILLGKFKREE